MIVLCPTCGGKGSIPDPKLQGQAMCYYNPHTGDSFPHATCRTCGGSGWVEFRVGGAMTSPTFRTGDNVEIIGPAEYGNTDHTGEKFEIETYHKEGPAFGGRDLYSACGFRWYPASSLRLVVASTGGGCGMNLSPLQMGDYRCLKAIRGLVQAVVGQETSSDELDCLNRLIKAAELFEIVERERVLYTPYPPPDLPAIREETRK